MSRSTRIAVLGAGIMGSCLALFLARRGLTVSLFDAAAEPFAGASRWNEGKIHLGYLYSADASLRTARHVQPGGLAFRDAVEELLECSIESAIGARRDVYLCHRDSIVPPDAMHAYMREVTSLLHTSGRADDYLADVRGALVEPLDRGELAELCDPDEIIAGFRVPEHSVDPGWIADRFVGAIAAEHRVHFEPQTRVTGVFRDDTQRDTWHVETQQGTFGPFDVVVNALWEGRLAVDLSAGVAPHGPWSHRYRRALFVRTREALDTPCATIATGPFGDVKNYDGRNFYLSWYPAGLAADGVGVSPPAVVRLDDAARRACIEEMFAQLTLRLPWVTDIRRAAEHVLLEGGWVFATGGGVLSDPASSLHRRSDYGVLRSDGYVSIDTGKYSTAPWLARRLAHQLL